MAELDQGLSPEEAAELRQALERANKRADEEGQRADGLHAQVRNSSRSQAEAELAAISGQQQQAESAVASLNAEIASLRAQRTGLLQEGKFEEEGEINEKIAVAVAKREQANQAATFYKGKREAASAEPADPVERFLARGNYSDAEKTWIRQHPRYATDAGFLDRVNGAHAKATGEGIARGTPEYFKALEDAGYQRAAPPAPKPAPGQVDDGGEGSPYSEAAEIDDQGEPVEPRPAARAQPRSGAAAPSRRAPTTPGSRQAPQNVRLTPDQAAAALAASEYFPEDVQNEGEAAIYAYWAKLNQSPMANRLREQWSTGA